VPVAAGRGGRAGFGGGPIALARSRRGPYRSARGVVTVEPVLTAVLPVYNGGEEIVDNVDVIRRALVEGLPGEDIEMIVVSDGSIGETVLPTNHHWMTCAIINRLRAISATARHGAVRDSRIPSLSTLDRLRTGRLIDRFLSVRWLVQPLFIDRF